MRLRVQDVLEELASGMR
ncbi:MAG: hypothetical protein LBO20_00285 [Bifidobacteriaceae bacterium]|nr:hypothetical protein [Bifidobacteriaceae bacterium]